VSDSPSDIEAKSLAAECTDREWAFAREYIIDLNGTQAVLRSGCFRVSSATSAATTASLLLRKPNVAAAVEVLQAQRASRVNMTADSVLHEMAALSHSDINNYIVDDDGRIQLREGAPANAMSAIKSVKHKKTIKEDDKGNVVITHDVEITLWDKPGSLKLMGRNVGLFPDKVEVSGPNGGPVQTVTKIERVVVDSPTQQS
jgi:phage terminase small subunit